MASRNNHDGKNPARPTNVPPPPPARDISLMRTLKESARSSAKKDGSTSKSK